MALLPQAFRGVWRMQQGSDGTHSTLLCYSLYVQPQSWLPVRLIQSRIQNEVVSNLQAVRTHSEKLHQQGSASEGAAVAMA